MTLSLEEVSDRLEIGQLLAAYAHAVDGQDWPALDALFCSDAVIDLRATGGPMGGVTEIKTFLARTLPLFASTQHLLGASLVTLDGDRAQARTSCSNPMAFAAAEGPGEVWLIGLWYEDALVRTAEGWRIRHREQELAYVVRDLRNAGLPTGP